jgi:rubrerythrin
MDFGGTARQQHGMNFEKWLKDTFFKSFTQTGPTDKWDATNVSYKSKYALHTSTFGGLSISIKTCKYGQAVNFGDAIRQLENNEDFLLVVAFWQNAGRHKKIVSIGAVKIDAQDWQNLFITEEEADVEDYDEYLESETIKKIRDLDRGIKRDERSDYKDARAFAKKAKKEIPETSMSINPKIDSKKQRRLQCTMPFSVFQELFKTQFVFQTGTAEFWGEDVPLLD